MQRPITGFHRDELGDWVAELRCGHGQHVRNQPPLVSRPWVLTEDGRASRLGVPLDCVRCDRFEMPEGFAPYKQTPAFTAETVPAALLSAHSTRAGVWARIEVLEGRLRYQVFAPLERDSVLEPGEPGIIPAEVEHRVEPLGDVRFTVEFFRRA